MLRLPNPILCCRLLSRALPLLLLSSVVLAEPPSRTFASREGKAKTVRLLTIGNSFSRNATRFLNDLAEAAGHTLVHHPIIVGGASLELHAGKAVLHAREPENPAGLYADGQSLRQKLHRDRWDAVTIQQASRISHDLQTYRPYAAQLRDIIREQVPQARLFIHQTWAYRVDDPRFTGSVRKTGEPASQQEMHRSVRSAYVEIARELEAGLIPVGDAFHAVAEDPVWGYRTDESFGFANATYPQLPDQRHSLHVGWRWRTAAGGKRQLGIDGHHANTAGEYLGSCVFYEVLFQDDVTQNSFLPVDLDPAFARYLQQTAHRIVAATRAETASPAAN